MVKSITTTASKNSNVDMWCSTKKIEIPHKTLQSGNCLYERVASFLENWRGKSIEQCLTAIRWAQILEHTQRGFTMMNKFEETKENLDAYGKSIFLSSLTT